jgi:hypothetical protein
VEKVCTAGEAPDDNTIRRTRCAAVYAVPRIRCSRWTTKATDTHSECVIFIAFPLQQWLCERDSMLRYINIACLVRSAIQIALLFLVHSYGVSATCLTFFAVSISYFHSTSTSY